MQKNLYHKGCFHHTDIIPLSYTIVCGLTLTADPPVKRYTGKAERRLTIGQTMHIPP